MKHLDNPIISVLLFTTIKVTIVYRSGSRVSPAERCGPTDAADPHNLTWVIPA